ncbi:MAG: universal stress protein [Proteobacteria bacterium]|nr:universal stress protein [Pseudomonadota bacterium]
MARGIRHILMTIGDEDHAPASALRKAAILARASGATLELFHSMDEVDPRVGFPETLTAQTLRQRRVVLAGHAQRRLEHLARDRTLRGLRVTCTVAWDYPPHEAIVRRAARSHADLVVAAVRAHPPGARLLLHNTDWELIRHCPVPVLLVKSYRAWRKPAVIAAVDPFHAHARPAELDARLLELGSGYARLLKGQLHVFHAFTPLLETVPFDGVPLAALPPEVEAAHQAQIERTVGELAAAARVPAGRRHVCMGGVVDELRRVTRKTRAGLIVMGAVSRSALKRMFIGNAAERVLDKLDCDLLVVKPRGFKSQMLSARRGTLAGSARAGTSIRSRRRPALSPRPATTVLPVLPPPV